MQWGGTVDNVSRYAYLDGDLVLIFGFWQSTHLVPGERGRIFAARIAPDEFVTILVAADFLEAESSR
jgi:hypothetical protein